MKDEELVFHLYLTQILLLAIAFISGWILFGSIVDLFGLMDWTDMLVWKAGAVAGLVVVAADLLLMKLLPAKYYDDGGLNERIFANQSIGKIALICLVVSFSEELLFRGVIQTNFGIVIASLIFALVHYRYLSHWFLFLNVVTLSFVIGYIYMRTGNLAVTVAMHFIIDFLLGIAIRLRSKNKQAGMLHE